MACKLMEYRGMWWSIMEYHWIPCNVKERRHGTSMEHLWNISGTPMEYQAISWDAYWIAHYIQGLPMELLWNTTAPLGSSIGDLWNIYCICSDALPEERPRLPGDDHGSLNSLKLLRLPHECLTKMHRCARPTKVVFGHQHVVLVHVLKPNGVK